MSINYRNGLDLLRSSPFQSCKRLCHTIKYASITTTMDIKDLKTWAEEDLQEGRPPEDLIEGTQWRVGLYPGYVLKTPRNPKVHTAAQLYDRHMWAVDLMTREYYGHVDMTPPVPQMALVDENRRMVQQRVYGRTLDELTDEEIMLLPDETLHDLWLLLDCSLTVSNGDGMLKDFLDLTGYNFKLPPFQRLIQALQTRYSTNIMIDHDGNLVLVDPDCYYASARNLGTKISAASMKPLMMLFTKIFRDRIGKLLQEL